MGCPILKKNEAVRQNIGSSINSAAVTRDISARLLKWLAKRRQYKFHRDEVGKGAK